MNWPLISKEKYDKLRLERETLKKELQEITSECERLRHNYFSLKLNIEKQDLPESLKYKLLVEDTKRHSYASNGLDLKLADRLPENGFFIEAGANNGITQSNTLYLEKYMGWSGLLIEPVPELYQQCVVNRPKCIVEPCALVSNTYTNDSIEIYHAGLASLVHGARGKQKDDNSWLRKNGVDANTVNTSSVSARTLNQVLEKHQIKHIDLISLDVEGYEESVLGGFDINLYQPTYLLIETSNKNKILEMLGDKYDIAAELTKDWDILYELKNEYR